ncbi:MAG: hypothetical protein LKE37_03025 [Atopobiaceae bacterium]|nr:hypothetical protein [Atopobiaceae bacterium]
MAMTRDYMDYLDEQVAIAPANSQEELQAAQTIAEVFDAHGLEPKIQEFETGSTRGFVYGIILVFVFLGMLLSGMGGAVGLVGTLLAIASAGMLAARYLGNDLLKGLDKGARSQNVIACHHASGPLVSKGVRPIVIVAHYDTPRADIISQQPISRYRNLIMQAARYCIPAVAVLALLQLLGFLPDGARRLLYVIGLVASLPVLLWGVSTIASRFMPCTEGASDNKAAVAAMLGVLENVCPTGVRPVVEHTREERMRAKEVVPEAAPKEPEPKAEEVPEKEERIFREVPSVGEAKPLSAAGPSPAVPVGIRHGEEVLRSLGMLPEDCEIVYEPLPVVEPEPEPAIDERPAAEPLPDFLSGATAPRAATQAPEPGAAPAAPDDETHRPASGDVGVYGGEEQSESTAVETAKRAGKAIGGAAAKAGTSIKGAFLRIKGKAADAASARKEAAAERDAAEEGEIASDAAEFGAAPDGHRFDVDRENLREVPVIEPEEEWPAPSAAASPVSAPETVSTPMPRAAAQPVPEEAAPQTAEPEARSASWPDFSFAPKEEQVPPVESPEGTPGEEDLSLDEGAAAQPEQPAAEQTQAQEPMAAAEAPAANDEWSQPEEQAPAQPQDASFEDSYEAPVADVVEPTEEYVPTESLTQRLRGWFSRKASRPEEGSQQPEYYDEQESYQPSDYPEYGTQEQGSAPEGEVPAERPTAAVEQAIPDAEWESVEDDYVEEEPFSPEPGATTMFDAQITPEPEPQVTPEPEPEAEWEPEPGATATFEPQVVPESEPEVESEPEWEPEPGAEPPRPSSLMSSPSPNPSPSGNPSPSQSRNPNPSPSRSPNQSRNPNPSGNQSRKSNPSPSQSRKRNSSGGLRPSFHSRSFTPTSRCPRRSTPSPRRMRSRNPSPRPTRCPRPSGSPSSPGSPSRLSMRFPSRSSPRGSLRRARSRRMPPSRSRSLSSRSSPSQTSSEVPSPWARFARRRRGRFTNSPSRPYMASRWEPSGARRSGSPSGLRPPGCSRGSAASPLGSRSARPNAAPPTRRRCFRSSSPSSQSRPRGLSRSRSRASPSASRRLVPSSLPAASRRRRAATRRPTSRWWRVRPSRSPRGLPPCRSPFVPSPRHSPRRTPRPTSRFPRRTSPASTSWPPRTRLSGTPRATSAR